MLSKSASPVPSTHKWDVLQLYRVYCAAPQRPNGPHTLAPHSPGEFPSRFRVSSPSGHDDKTLSLSSSGFFCLVVRIQTKQRKSTFGNELELGGGGAPHKGIFYSLRGDAGTGTTRGKVGGPKQNFRVREGYEEGPGTGVGGDLGLGDLKNRQSCLHAREWSQNDRPRTHQNLSDFMFYFYFVLRREPLFPHPPARGPPSSHYTKTTTPGSHEAHKQDLSEGSLAYREENEVDKPGIDGC